MTRDALPADRPTTVRWLVLALACVTSALLYVHRYSWGVIKSDIKEEFHLTDTQLGWLDSAFQAAYTIGQVPTGMAGDRWGPAAVLPLMILGWSGAVGATALGQGFWSFAAIRFGFGAAQAGAYPNLTKVTRSWFPTSMRTTVQGLVAVTSGRIGGACAPLVIGTLLLHQLGFDWRTALLIIAAAGVFLAIATRIILRDSPARHPWTNTAERRLVESDDPAPGQQPLDKPHWRTAVLVSLAFLMLQSFTSTFADALFVYWIPLFLEEGKGLDKGAMGIFASLPLIGGAIGGVVGGMLNDLVIRRTGNLRLARAAVGLSGKLVAAGFIVASLAVEDGRWMMVVVAVAKFFTDWSVPTLWGAVTDIGGRLAGRVFGLVNTIGAVGGIVAGPVLGHIKESFGWPALFWLISAVYILSALCWLGVDPRHQLTGAR